MAGERILRTLTVPEDVDTELKVLAARSKLSKSALYEAGARILLALAREGRMPSELGVVLRRWDPWALEVISRVIVSAGGARVGQRGGARGG